MYGITKNISFFVILTLIFSQTTYAQKSEAKKLFDDGKEKYSQDNLVGAATIWEYALQLDKTNMKTKSVLINALIILGKNQCKQGDFEESLSTIEKALEYDPRNKELNSLQEKIKEIFAISLETESEKVPDRYLRYLNPRKEKSKQIGRAHV